MPILLTPWIYELETNYTRDISKYMPPNWNKGLQFIDKGGVPRLEINRDGLLTVYKKYSWDGCSPKFSVLDIVIGTPDGVPHKITKKPKTYYASLVHDSLYQFLHDGLPLQRKYCDQIFLDILTEYEFLPRHAYYYAVRLFGAISLCIARKIRKWEGSFILLDK